MFFDFRKNPVLFLEVSRILSGLSEFVILQGFLRFQIQFQSIYEAFEDYLRGKISVEELFDEAAILENCVRLAIFDEFSSLGVEPYPMVIFVNRVLSGEVLNPDMQLFVGRDDEKLQGLRKLEGKILEGKVDFHEGKRKLIEMEGELLGYPKCCVENYAESKGKFPAESRLILECAEKGVFSSVLSAFRNSEVISLPQFFTAGFYPCSAYCENALKVGEGLREWLGEYKTAFDLRSMITVLFYCATGLKASRYGRYGKALRKYYSTISNEDLEILKTLEPHIANQTEFTNLFIRRIMK